MAKKITKTAQSKVSKKDDKVVPLKSAKKNAAPSKASKKTVSASEKVSKEATKIFDVCNQTFVPSVYPFKPAQYYMEMIMTKNPMQFDQIAQEATAASRESLEAVSKSCSIFAKGYESLMRTSMEMSQTAAEKQASYAKEAMSCKTLNEFTEMQNKIAQSNFDDFMSSMTKLSEMSTKIITETAEPINEQMTKAAEKVTKAA